MDWDKWLYAPGLPPKPDFDTTLVDVCYNLASKWEQAMAENFEPNAEDVSGWKAKQKVVFLDSVQLFEKPLDKRLVRAMGKAYGFEKSSNAEVVARYFGVGLRSRDEDVYKPTAELLGSIGRMKFVRPL